jgi:D-alanyl-D-alanine carboxypeptidase
MKLLYISIAAFFITATTAISTSVRLREPEIVIVPTVSARTGEVEFADIPILVGKETFPILSAQSVLAVDLGSGATLYEKNPDSSLLPASTTKIITALVSLDIYKLNKVLTVKSGWVEGQKMGLVEGEKISVRDLLYGLLVYSANDAAEVLANNYPGGREAFILAMNEKAREFNLEGSHFTNPSGLETEGHYTTARDLARIASVAMKNPIFAKIVSTKQKIVESVD